MTTAVRLRRAAHQLWVLGLAASIVAACAAAAASQFVDLAPRPRLAAYLAFPVLLVSGLVTRLTVNRLWPVVRRLDGVTGPRATVVLGQVTVTAGQLVFGDPDLPPRGTVLEMVPNGTFDVLADVHRPQDGAALASFHILFRPKAQPDTRDKASFTLRSGVAAVSDPRAADRFAPKDRRRARRAMHRAIERGRDDPTRPYFQSHLDEGDKPWSVTFEAARGRDEYRLHVKRLGGVVVRIDCTLSGPESPRPEER